MKRELCVGDVVLEFDVSVRDWPYDQSRYVAFARLPSGAEIYAQSRDRVVIDSTPDAAIDRLMAALTEACDQRHRSTALAELASIRSRYRDLLGEVREARAALGEGWMRGTDSLAVGIRRKSSALEALGHSSPQSPTAAQPDRCVDCGHACGSPDCQMRHGGGS
jgi:hypothetical protein